MNITLYRTQKIIRWIPILNFFIFFVYAWNFFKSIKHISYWRTMLIFVISSISIMISFFFVDAAFSSIISSPTWESCILYYVWGLIAASIWIFSEEYCVELNAVLSKPDKKVDIDTVINNKVLYFFSFIPLVNFFTALLCLVRGFISKKTKKAITASAIVIAIMFSFAVIRAIVTIAIPSSVPSYVIDVVTYTTLYISFLMSSLIALQLLKTNEAKK